MLIFDFWICNFSSWFFATSSKWTIHEIEIFVKAAHNLVNRLKIVAKVSGKTQIIFCTLDGTFFASGDCFEAFVHVFEIVSFWIRWNNTVGSKCFLNFHLFQQVQCCLEVVELIRCFWINLDFRTNHIIVLFKPFYKNLDGCALTYFHFQQNIVHAYPIRASRNQIHVSKSLANSPLNHPRWIWFFSHRISIPSHMIPDNDLLKASKNVLSLNILRCSVYHIPDILYIIYKYKQETLL